MTATDSKVSALTTMERDGDLAIVSMNNPPHNLLAPALLGSLMDSLQKSVDEGARAVLLNSALKNFSAGADLALFTAAFKRNPDNPESSKDPSGRGTSMGSQKANGHDALAFLEFMQDLPVPIVASVRGACLGGGFEVALACDIIVASRSARLGSVEVAIGVAPLMGGVQRLVERIGLVRAKEFAMLGRRHDAEALEQMGVINLAVDESQLEDVSLNFAQQLANGPTIALNAVKQLANLSAGQGVGAADQAMKAIIAPVFKSKDAENGIKALQRTGPGTARFEGC